MRHPGRAKSRRGPERTGCVVVASVGYGVPPGSTQSRVELSWPAPRPIIASEPHAGVLETSATGRASRGLSSCRNGKLGHDVQPAARASIPQFDFSKGTDRRAGCARCARATYGPGRSLAGRPHAPLEPYPARKGGKAGIHKCLA